MFSINIVESEYPIVQAVKTQCDYHERAIQFDPYTIKFALKLNTTLMYACMTYETKLISNVFWDLSQACGSLIYHYFNET